MKRIIFLYQGTNPRELHTHTVISYSSSVRLYEYVEYYLLLMLLQMKTTRGKALPIIGPPSLYKLIFYLYSSELAHHAGIPRLTLKSLFIRKDSG